MQFSKQPPVYRPCCLAGSWIRLWECIVFVILCGGLFGLMSGCCLASFRWIWQYSLFNFDLWSDPRFKSPRPVIALKFCTALTNLLNAAPKPGALKTAVETIGFQHLDVDAWAALDRVGLSARSCIFPLLSNQGCIILLTPSVGTNKMTSKRLMNKETVEQGA